MENTHPLIGRIQDTALLSAEQKDALLKLAAACTHEQAEKMSDIFDEAQSAFQERAWQDAAEAIGDDTQKQKAFDSLLHDCTQTLSKLEEQNDTDEESEKADHLFDNA